MLSIEGEEERGAGVEVGHVGNEPPDNYTVYQGWHTVTPLHQTLREVSHGFELPSNQYKLQKQSFSLIVYLIILNTPS